MRADVRFDRLAVAEMEPRGSDNLILFMPLAGDEDDVAAARFAERGSDRRRPVGLTPDRGARRDARHDMVDDPLGPLAARVVGGDGEDVAQARRDGAHAGAFRPVAVAAAAEDGDDAAPPLAGAG